MIHSIRFKLFFIFVILLGVFMFVFFILNSFFLDNIFIQNNKNKMEKMYNIYKKNIENNEEVEIIEDLSAESGMHITVIDNMKIITTTHPGHIRQSRMFMVPGTLKILKAFINSSKDTIFFISPHVNLQNKRLIFIGKLEQKKLFIVEKPLGIIKETSSIAVRFIIICGLIVFIIGSFIIFILSNKLTKPIIAINKSARAIANQDFSKKINYSSHDEIGTLAESINLISDKLNKALTDLIEANSKLKEDIEKERKLEKMRRRFVSNVSHELKTPISMILGYADGLKHNIAKTPDDMEYYCNVIIEESNKMNKLVKDLLDLSSYESGAFKINRQDFDMAKLVRETTAKYTNRLKNNKIDVKLICPNNLIVNADKMRMDQIITNFLSNAEKHVDSFGEIIINLHQKKESFNFSVFNTGNKIDADEINEIWNSFYKVHSKNKNTNEGTGLGLAIVKAIVELHGGSYGAENIENGVMFWIDIPFLKTTDTN